MSPELNIDRVAILEVFREESEEALLASEEALLRLDAHPDDAEALATIFRHAHTLKGNAWSLGFPALGGFAHAAEDVLERLRDGRLTPAPELMAKLLRVVDELRALLRAGESAALTAAQAALRDDLALLASGAQLARHAQSHELSAVAARRPALRVDVDKLDRILALTGEMAVARVRLANLLSGEALDLHEEIEHSSRELHEALMQVRALPILSAFRPLARVLHDAAAACAKQARLAIEGGDVEADTAVIEGIRDALAHLVRNAVVHGLETPSARAAAGKDPRGLVTLRARHEGGALTVEVDDDGAGFDKAGLERAARARGLDPTAMSEPDLLDVAFQPGVSTAAEVTTLAGRGVGLDVVRNAVEELRGSVEVTNRPGRGAMFTLRLPLSVAIIEGFAVRSAGETWVVPMRSVVECLDLPPGTLESRGAGVVAHRGEALPWVRLSAALGLGDSGSSSESLVVVQAGARRAGIAVDALDGACEVVLKPLGRLLRGAPCATGSAILSTGRVALIADAEAVLREALRRSRPLGATA